MPRREVKTLSLFNPFDLATLLDSLFGGGIDAAGRLVEVKGRGTHNVLEHTNQAKQIDTIKPLVDPNCSHHLTIFYPTK